MFKIICIALLALSSPVLAKDVSSSAFYMGAHVSTARGVSQDQFAMDAGDKIETSGNIGGLIIGHVWRSGAVNLSIESDIGVGLIEGTYRGDNYTDTYRIRLNGHLRSKLGYELSERLNIFVTGGLAAASHQYAYDFDVGNAESDTRWLLGWTIGAGVGFEVLKGTVVNLEFNHDDYGKKEYYFPEADIHEDARASADFLRVSVIHEF